MKVEKLRQRWQNCILRDLRSIFKRICFLRKKFLFRIRLLRPRTFGVPAEKLQQRWQIRLLAFHGNILKTIISLPKVYGFETFFKDLTKKFHKCGRKVSTSTRLSRVILHVLRNLWRIFSAKKPKFQVFASAVRLELLRRKSFFERNFFYFLTLFL